MTNELQIAANRANAQKSTGPVTAEGLKKSARNSLKHGLFARTLVLDKESSERFTLLVDGLIEEFMPETVTEMAMVENMAVARWQQMRGWTFNRNMLAEEIERLLQSNMEFAAKDAPTQASIAFRSLVDTTKVLDSLNRYEARWDRQFLRCRDLLLKAREKK